MSSRTLKGEITNGSSWAEIEDAIKRNDKRLYNRQIKANTLQFHVYVDPEYPFHNPEIDRKRRSSATLSADILSGRITVPFREARLTAMCSINGDDRPQSRFMAEIAIRSNERDVTTGDVEADRIPRTLIR